MRRRHSFAGSDVYKEIIYPDKYGKVYQVRFTVEPSLSGHFAETEWAMRLEGLKLDQCRYAGRRNLLVWCEVSVVQNRAYVLDESNFAVRKMILSNTRCRGRNT